LLLLLLRVPRLVTRVPRLPLLSPWYRLCGSDDRLLLEYGQRVVALEGGAVRTLLPALLPLLDGTRTYDELLVRLGAPVRPALDQALEVLAANDLLVEGPDAPPDLRQAAHAVAAAYELAPGVAEARLRNAAVEIVGSAAAAAEIARLIRSSGIRDVRRCRWRGSGRVDLALVVPAADEFDRIEGWNRLALETGVPWLAVRPYDGCFAGVGPLIVPGESCCYDCVLRRRAANLEYGDHLAEIEAAPTATHADAAFETIVVALAAHLAVRWVGGRDVSLPGVLYTVEARPALSIGAHAVLRVPRCPACSSAERVAGRLPWHEAAA
jgi:bacteriocin biosynthesis cyclodehydratase domain-containing protein